jgi:hypothetical protein
MSINGKSVIVRGKGEGGGRNKWRFNTTLEKMWIPSYTRLPKMHVMKNDKNIC